MQPSLCRRHDNYQLKQDHESGLTNILAAEQFTNLGIHYRSFMIHVHKNTDTTTKEWYFPASRKSLS